MFSWTEDQTLERLCLFQTHLIASFLLVAQSWGKIYWHLPNYFCINKFVVFVLKMWLVCIPLKEERFLAWKSCFLMTFSLFAPPASNSSAVLITSFVFPCFFFFVSLIILWASSSKLSNYHSWDAWQNAWEGRSRKETSGWRSGAETSARAAAQRENGSTEERDRTV